ncbi:MAG: hypothetical protein EBU97_01525 [Rhodobacteraceae bacterium]|nr:hypothetical protein [Paracoccaceae bacterium]
MTPDQVRACFTRKDGQFLCARWGRPIVPVVFGVGDDTLRVVKGALEAVVALAGHRLAETDPELGANLMMFFCKDWAEVAAVPNLDRLIPDLGALCERLQAADANQYRVFRFDPEGAIRAAFVFVRMDAHLNAVPAEALALAQAAETILLWSDLAFAETGPLGQLADGALVLRPDIAQLIRAAYDPVLPAVATDPAHALRLVARMGPLN